MAAVLNRKTNVYFDSVNTPDFDPADWIVNPDISAVEGFPNHYWVIQPDDTVTLMPEADRPEADLLLPYAVCSDLDAAKELKRNQVNDLRDRFIHGGWSYNGIRYDSDATSVQNIAGTMTAINSGYKLPDDFTWRTMDNQNIPFTNASFVVFFLAASKWRELAYHSSWTHKAAILQLTSIADVANYDFTVGWVKGFVLTESGLQPVM